MSEDFEDRMLSESGYKSYIEKIEGELANAKRIRDDNFKIAAELVGERNKLADELIMAKQKSAKLLEAEKELLEGYRKNGDASCWSLMVKIEKAIAEYED